jgi:hypothetical protein
LGLVSLCQLMEGKHGLNRGKSIIIIDNNNKIKGRAPDVHPSFATQHPATPTVSPGKSTIATDDGDGDGDGDDNNNENGNNDYNDDDINNSSDKHDNSYSDITVSDSPARPLPTPSTESTTATWRDCNAKIVRVARPDITNQIHESPLGQPTTANKVSCTICTARA